LQIVYNASANATHQSFVDRILRVSEYLK